MNKLFYGDNLDVLRLHIKDESVDLVYLDPPFQSGKDYNVLFSEKDGKKARAQIKAFEDTWCWSVESEAAFHDVVNEGGAASDTAEMTLATCDISTQLRFCSRGSRRSRP